MTCWVRAAPFALSIVVGVVLVGAGALTAAGAGTTLIVGLPASALFIATACAAAGRRNTPLWLSPRWWSHPALLAIFAAAPPIAGALVVSSTTYATQWHTPKFFSSYDFVLDLTALATFAIAAGVAGRTRGGVKSSDLSRLNLVRAARAARVLFSITMSGYVIWTFVALARGLRAASLVAILTGSPGAVSAAKVAFLRPVTGATTLTQVGPVAAILYAYLFASGRRRAGLPLAALALLALARTLFYAERLAVLEIAVPVGFLALNSCVSAGPSMRNVASKLFPLWAPVALLLFFGTFEHVRSWDSYYRHQPGQTSYPTFVVHRLEGYYVTAQNNSALLLRTSAVARPAYYSANWLWRFPGVSRSSLAAGITTPSDWTHLLQTRANPEFNNEGSFLVPVAEFGSAGLLLWVLFGALVGTAYRGFRLGSTTGLIIYPLLTTGLLELGRIYYWPEGRTFPMVTGALITSHYLRRSERHAEVPDGHEHSLVTARA